MPDTRYENQKIIVKEETPLQVSWRPSRVFYKDLNPEIKELVMSAWNSPHRLETLKEIGRQLEDDNAWSCTVSLVGWQRCLEYKVVWESTAETLSNLSAAAQESIVAQLEAKQYRVVSRMG